MTDKTLVAAFCDWLDTIPPEPPFYRHPDFAQFSDLTDQEITAAQTEMRRRAIDADMAVAALRAERLKRTGRVRVIVANDDDPLGGPAA